jgi:hypothetical protein
MSQNVKPGSLADANQLLRPAANSYGVAVEGSPRRQPWIEVLAIEPRSGERKSSWAGILSPLTGLLAGAYLSPRLTPWATLFRHSVADAWRLHRSIKLNIDLVSPHLQVDFRGGNPVNSIGAD